MQQICRLSFYFIAGFAALRAVFFFLYATYQLPSPVETHPLEAEMVHLSWRVQNGLSLYPQWQTYPYVANFFAPVYFWCVGCLGKAFDADMEGLFLIGRLVTFFVNLFTALSLGSFLYPRYGLWVAFTCAIVTLGASPLHGFAVMVRPDLMADFLGVAGFLLSIQRKRTTVLVGGALLVAACLTKQTAGMYLLASLAACWLSPTGRRLGWLLAGWTTALLGVAMMGIQLYEPNSLRCWFEEAGTPFVGRQWLKTFQHLLTSSPDLLLFAFAGTIAWMRSRPRENELAVFAIVVLAVCLATSAKLGSDLNYFLGLRGVEALAVGKLWHSTTALNGRPGPLAATALLLGAISMIPSVRYGEAQFLHKRQQAAYLASPSGREMLGRHYRVLRLAEQPKLQVLSDSGMLALRQRERAPFVDPWLFRMLVQTGRIDPRVIEDRIRLQAYDALVLTSDLYSPPYEAYIFGLPAPLVRAARGRYQLAGHEAGFFIYRPVGRPAEGTDEPLPGTSFQRGAAGTETTVGDQPAGTDFPQIFDRHNLENRR